MKDRIAENIEYYDETWLEKVIKQEEILKVDNFTREDAIALGNLCVKKGWADYQSGVAVDIFMDGCTVFSCRPMGTGMKNTWWITCKYNTILKTGVSSIRAQLERTTGKIPFEAWCYDKMSYLLCGGGFPIVDQHGKILAAAVVSALKHEEDHQLLANSIAEFLGKEIPSLLK